MQSVPSLVGTGTAVAAAAAGLVFGQPVEVEAPWSSPYQGVFPVDYDGFRVQFLSPRPSTSAAAPHRRSPSPLEDFPYVSFRQLADAEPASVTSPVTESPRASPRPVSAAQVSSPKANSRRHSFLRQGDLASRPIAENARDSVSSRDSWIRRFSLRPLSQNGSPRSSMGPDSSSMTFSHGSGVPMLGQQTTPAHPAPNKLVKRTTAGQTQVPGGYQRRGSKSQVLTLRRPATSHQRSATLQQARPLTSLVNEPPASAGAGATFSFGPQSVPASVAPASPTYSSAKRFSGKWTSFFHARRAVSLFRDASKLPNGQSASHASVFPRKRVSLMPGHISRAYLTKADCITDIPVVIDEEERLPQDWVDGSEIRENSQGSSNSDSPNSTPDQRARRSMSMHFTATSWIARTSSVRRPRRSTIDAKGGNGGRYATDVVGTARAPGSQPPVSPATEQIFTPPNYQRQSLQQLEPEPPKLNDPPRSRKRNTSSLPPLTRLSSFNIDVSRIGLSTPSSAAQPRSFHTPINYMTNSQHPPSLTHSRGPSGERSVTLAGSDLDAHDGGYGDDDETDFRSDAYDSFRTMASSSRVRETPLESMFDESPPSTASNGRTKRLSIQEILGRPWDDETKITEEDESQATPVRSGHLAEPAQFEGRIGKVGNFSYDAQPALALVNRDFGRLSFDDDDDDDWARDDDNTLSNHLSPPSSTNSRRVSPTLRHALRNLGATGSPDPQRDSIGDRPKSSIFDWSEPSIHDKYDSDMPRPKTVHGKQEMDLRIGRSTSRKQPSAAHVRSQSVPVVPDPTDNSKPPPKFGTWGLSSKNVSEDWDDDFDFDEIAVDSTGGKDSATSFMVVPASIQATQPTVKAHSGQIRELSLLVNDLKRLCRHGKELDILHGPTSAKFTEAENIIALASPDEDDAEFGSAKSSMDFDRCRTGNRFIDEGFGGSSLDTIDDPFDIPEPEMTRTTVVRERQSYRRRSVFSPDDDIFGNWPGPEESTRPSRPRTPDSRASPRSSAVIATVIEAMQQQRSTSLSSSNPTKAASVKTQDTKLFFDTNSLQELVKRAGHLRDSLSDAVRRAELITQSPAATPRRERHFRHNPDGSPAFTLVFSDPAAASPPRRLPKSHSTNSVLSRTSVDSPRMQMMIVS